MLIVRLADLEDVVSQLEQEKEELAEELESKTADFERLVANFEEARSEVATLKVPSTLPVAQAKGRWQGDLDAAGRELEKSVGPVNYCKKTRS
jgi:chromosome segregation ATPase